MHSLFQPPLSLLQKTYATSSTSSIAPMTASRSLSPSIIVGGGLAGLAAATHLSSLSVPFLLLEASDSFGGRARTDLHEGFLLDRGFHIFLSSFPECRRLLNFSQLDLQPFYPGSLVYESDRFHRISDPFRRPLDSLPSIFNPIGSLPDKLLVGLTRLSAASLSDDSILSSDESTIYDHLKSIGFSDSIIEKFLRPFFAGIFFDPNLSTSSRLFKLVFKSLALGENALPAGGIGSIAQQLVARLPDTSLRTNSPVTSISAGSVTLASGEAITTDSGIIVAVEQPQAKKLIPKVFGSNVDADVENLKKPTRSTVCLYFSADQAPIAEPILILNGSGKGIVNNMFFVTNVAPSYAPKGKVLVSVSLIGAYQDRSDEDLTAEVLQELTGWFGSGVTGSWRHLRTYRIEFAQPDQTPPTNPIGRDPRVDEGLYVCGDHWSWATFDGALVSGLKAAEALVRDRGLIRR
ncbi:FAD/NAD(P)-binding oxidoreductase family protein [Rhynchospora pubera]|uniref:FAD/NAD(P)-binding oxidoreductase family protein n=1 Tax=Rhynchospora pubera TaxID=906938 RepID=A0AAV8FRM0_9POAL|nr:FAD/NAD(P)-binding oxidoreductase family protein [Rhynchospora pubera]